MDQDRKDDQSEFLDEDEYGSDRIPPCLEICLRCTSLKKRCNKRLSYLQTFPKDGVTCKYRQIPRG